MLDNQEQLKRIVEGALLAAGKPLSIDQLLALFVDEHQPSREQLHEALDLLQRECEGRGVELREISSGFRFQVKQEVSPWVSRLWEEKPARYSRALMETLALIAYRQPITRAEIEDIRGVAVSTNIVKTLQEREWIRVVGHRDVPGKPAMYATTREFLDHFNLKSLDDLPTLAEIRDLDTINAELDLQLQEHIADFAPEGVPSVAMAEHGQQALLDANLDDAPHGVEEPTLEDEPAPLGESAVSS